MDKVELRKCPFCGCVPRISKVMVIDYWDIYCNNNACLAHVAVFGKPYKDAIKAWNRRAGE